jgi:hypothetical protein
MKSGARSPTATVGATTGIVPPTRIATQPPSTATKMSHAAIRSPFFPSPPQPAARSAAGNAKRVSVHQPLRNAGTVRRRTSATTTPMVARIARTWTNDFIA